MNDTIVRLRDTGTVCFGEYRNPAGERQWYTIERPWLMNRVGVSCIPPTLAADGTRLREPYPVVDATHHPGTPGAYPCKEITDVFRRTAIQIHKDNVVETLEGCVGLGETEGMGVNPTTGAPEAGVWDSGDAFAAFLAARPGTFLLDIQAAPGIAPV